MGANRKAVVRGRKRYSLPLADVGGCIPCQQSPQQPKAETQSWAQVGVGRGLQTPRPGPQGVISMAVFPAQLPSPLSLLPSTVSALHS